jgi:hypothetical protein
MRLYSPTTAVEWLARQITEAFPQNEAPLFPGPRSGSAYNATFSRRLKAMGIPAKIFALPSR